MKQGFYKLTNKTTIYCVLLTLSGSRYNSMRERKRYRERERRFKQAYKRLTSDGNYLID